MWIFDVFSAMWGALTDAKSNDREMLEGAGISHDG